MAYTIYSQDVNDNELRKWKYFELFSDEQKLTIKDNWKQYFREEIITKLDNDINSFQVAFDSYGSVYPDLSLLKDVEFNKWGRSGSDNWAFSLYDIFASNKKTILQNVKSNPTLSDKEKSVYKNLLSIKKDYVNDSPFYSRWDSLHNSRVINTLNSRLKDENIKQVIFYIHGYNVPYSLAIVQMIALNNLMKTDLGIDAKSILFVPIVWSSNDMKNKEIYKKESFDITNFKGLGEGGLENGMLFWYYTNRAYYASIGLRKILNGMERKDLKVNIFAHSLGCVIATSALMPTTSKLDEKASIVSAIKQALTDKDTNEQERLKKSHTVSYEIIEGLTGVNTPTIAIKCFLSAPAMPGQNTFTDLEADKKEKYIFFSTLNKYDEMLTKAVSGIFVINEGNSNATSLGCVEQEAALTKQLFSPSEANFDYKIVSDRVDHDVFTYMNQNAYIEYLKKFFQK